LPTTEFTAFAICLVAIVCLAVRSVVPNPSPVVVAGSGAFGQALVVLTSRFLLHDLGLTPAADLYSASVLANGLGLLMVMYVLKDAESRSREEKLKLDAEHYRTLALSAELKALRAQIRPHFLFNVLTAIAALCRIDSERAETLVLKLGRLLRRNLEDSPSTATTVERELDFVKTYLDIQKARHEKVVNEIRCSPGMEKMEIPAFSIQTLVENAYNHGFSFGGTNGNVLVAITRSSKSIFVSVSDNGVGMPQSPIVDDQKRGDRIPHGLNIVDRQLRIQFGDQARLRFYSFPNRGTIAAFKIPRV
jgi:LytS/YehU family sensor histidine kinase